MRGLYVPRPDTQVMPRILHRDIKQFYPEAWFYVDAWVYACIEFAREVGDERSQGSRLKWRTVESTTLTTGART